MEEVTEDVIEVAKELELEVKSERFLNSEPEELEAKGTQTLNYESCWF